MKKPARLLLALALALLMAAPAGAKVTPNPLFTDNAVLQRDREIPVWGAAADGEKITVELNGKKAATTAKDGRWQVKLPPMPAGGPFELTISGENTLVIKNVLIGEVWLCSGQSNMERQLGPRGGQPNLVNWEADMAAAQFPEIRLLTIANKTAGTPQETFQGQWQVCAPETVKNFSAVAYYMGRDLHRELKAPVGLIVSAWGGTRVEPWMPRESLANGAGAVQNLREWLQKLDNEYDANKLAFLEAVKKWQPEAGQAAREGKPLPEPPQTPASPAARIAGHNQNVTALYNGMIHPIVPYALRGAVWYQGESNIGEPDVYCDLLKTLIAGWRAAFGQGDFPFYIVQIAPWYGYGVNDRLARLWQSEIKAAAETPNSGIAATMDVGNFKDIHPEFKEPVGGRLARLALANVYGRKDIAAQAPGFESVNVSGGKMEVKFSHSGGGLMSKDGKALSNFEIAGADKNFVPAEAAADGDTVSVSAPSVSAPKYVRYGWMILRDNAAPNLINKEGLPALPFQTE
jgi:sialate O-acetylesterase